jgi:hypothetical protein
MGSLDYAAAPKPLGKKRTLRPEVEIPLARVSG